MDSLSTRELFATNIKIGIAFDRDRGGPCYDMKRLAERAGLTPSTVGRILSLEHAPVIDTVESIAKALRLKPWQMLVPQLNPSAPPTVPHTDAERELYARIHRIALAYARTEDVENADYARPTVRPPHVRHTDREMAGVGPPSFDRRNPHRRR